jgi:hypothetical protein
LPEDSVIKLILFFLNYVHDIFQIDVLQNIIKNFFLGHIWYQINPPILYSATTSFDNSVLPVKQFIFKIPKTQPSTIGKQRNYINRLFELLSLNLGLNNEGYFAFIEGLKLGLEQAVVNFF